MWSRLCSYLYFQFPDDKLENILCPLLGRIQCHSSSSVLDHLTGLYSLHLSLSSPLRCHLSLLLSRHTFRALCLYLSLGNARLRTRSGAWLDILAKTSSTASSMSTICIFNVDLIAHRYPFEPKDCKDKDDIE